MTAPAPTPAPLLADKPKQKDHAALTTGVFIVVAVAAAFIALMLLSGSQFLTRKETVVMYFVGSVQGLQIGAPVKLKGVVLGEITDIQIDFRNNDRSVTTPQTIITAVTAELVMKRINRRGGDKKGEFFNEAIPNGLRAQLNFQSFLTGLLYIELDFYPKTPIVLYHLQTQDRELPTIATEFEQIFKVVQEIDFKGLVKNLDHLATKATAIIDSGVIENTLAEFGGAAKSVKNSADEINQLVKNLAQTRQQADKLLLTLNARAPEFAAAANKTLLDMQNSLQGISQAARSVDSTFAADAPLMFQLNTTLEDMSRSAQAFRSLSETLEQQPEALLQGKSTNPQEH